MRVKYQSRKIVFLMVLVIGLQLIPLACGQNEYGYASYSLTRYDAHYLGIHLVVEAPGNESIVATNQTLPVRVMPMDLDEANETLTMFVDGGERYEFKDENYYNIPVVVTSPLNSTFTIEFRVGNHTLLALDYPVLLTRPSMSDDYTDLFEELMREREEERMEELYTIVPKGYEKVITAEVIATTLAIALTAILLAAVIKKKTLLISAANGLNIFILMGLVIVGILYIGLRVSPYVTDEIELTTLYMVMVDFLVGLLYMASFIAPYFATYHVVKLSNQKVIHETQLASKNVNITDVVIYTNRKGEDCIARQDLESALHRLLGRHTVIEANGPLNSDWKLDNENELLLVDKVEVVAAPPSETDEGSQDDAHNSLLTPVLSKLKIDVPSRPDGEICRIDLAQVHFVDAFEFVHDVRAFERLRDKIDRLVESAHVYRHNMHALADTLASKVIERIWGAGPEETVEKAWVDIERIADSTIKQSSQRSTHG